MKILVTGASGHLGRSILSLVEKQKPKLIDHIVGVGRKERKTEGHKEQTAKRHAER